MNGFSSMEKELVNSHGSFTLHSLTHSLHTFSVPLITIWKISLQLWNSEDRKYKKQTGLFPHWGLYLMEDSSTQLTTSLDFFLKVSFIAFANFIAICLPTPLQTHSTTDKKHNVQCVVRGSLERLEAGKGRGALGVYLGRVNDTAYTERVVPHHRPTQVSVTCAFLHRYSLHIVDNRFSRLKIFNSCSFLVT